MATLATIENMREHYGEGMFAYSADTGEEYSANPADYWYAAAGWTMTDSNGKPMQLVTRTEMIRDVATSVSDWRASLAEALAEADRALGGDSNDDEHDALYSIRETIAGLLGVSPRPPLAADDIMRENTS